MTGITVSRTVTNRDSSKVPTMYLTPPSTMCTVLNAPTELFQGDVSSELLSMPVSTGS